jgi:hypothetical protein
MERTKLILIITIVLVMGGEISRAQAQNRHSNDLKRGDTLRQVLAAWGEPDERIERGVKRELVWRYKDGALVVFKDGRVKVFSSPATERIEQARKLEQAVAEKKTESEASSSKDVLRDIVRELPSGPDGPAPSEPQAPSTDPDLAGLIPNAVPQRGGQPGIAPGVVVPSPEDD